MHINAYMSSKPVLTQVKVYVRVSQLHHIPGTFEARVITFEPPHDKTNKMNCVHSKDSDQPGDPPSLISLRCLLEENLGP